MAKNQYPKIIIFVFAAFPSILLLLSFLDALPTKWAVMVLSGCIFATVAIITGDLKRCLLFVLILGISLNINPRIIHRDESGLINGVFLSICDISVLGLIVLWAMKLKTRNDSSDFRVHFYPATTRPLLLFVSAAFLSVLSSSDKTWSLFGIIYYVKLFLIYFVTANTLKTKKDLEYVMILLVFSLFIQSVVYIFQCYTGIDFDIVGNKMITGISKGLSRPRGFMGQSNTAGTFFAASLMFAGSLFFLVRRGKYKFLIGNILLLGIWALILTFSRGGWASFLIAGIVFLIIGVKQEWMNLRVIFTLSIALMLFIGTFWNSINLRLTYDLAAKSRLTTNEVAWKVIKEHAFLGVGMNAYKNAYDEYVTADLRSKGAMPILHNQYLLVWAEMGMIGLCSFIWFIFAFFRETKKSIASKDHFERILATGVMSSFLAICSAMMTQPANAGPIAVLTWFLAAYIVAIGRVMQSQSCDTHREG